MSIKSVFSKMLPFLSVGLNLAGPPGMLAANVLNTALGKTDIKPTPESMTQAITEAAMTSEGLEKLKEAENQYMLQMQKLGYDHVEAMQSLEDADIANARAREIAVKDKMPAVLAVGACATFLICITTIALFGVKEAAKDTMIFMLGILSGMVKDVYGFYFGSSKGSDDKSKTIADIAKS